MVATAPSTVTTSIEVLVIIFLLASLKELGYLEDVIRSLQLLATQARIVHFIMGAPSRVYQAAEIAVILRVLLGFEPRDDGLSGRFVRYRRPEPRIFCIWTDSGRCQPGTPSSFGSRTRL